MTELDRSRVGVRLLSVLLALDIAKNFVSPALWIAEEKSVISTVARMTSYPDMLALAWLAAAAMVLPYMLMQVFFPHTRHARRFTKIACNGVCFGGTIWIYLAYLSRNLDYEIVTPLFFVNGLLSIGLGAVLAYGLNADQIAAEKQAGPVHEAQA